jgi:hypothetical protein
MTCSPTASTTTEAPTGGSDIPSTVPSRSEKLIAEQWPVFAECIQERLEMGAKVYGDKSLDAPSSTLLVEIEQELLDVVGWGFIQWSRIQKLKAKLSEIEARCAAHNG